MKIKLISVCLLVCMLFSICGISTAMAAGDTVITVTGGQVNAGSTIDVTLSISGNPGIAGASPLKVEYPTGWVLTNMVQGSALSSLTFLPPGNYTANPISISLDGQDADSSNGVFMTLTFEVPASASGDYDIVLSYAQGAIYDNNMEDVEVSVVQGKVTVKGNTTHTHTPGNAVRENEVPATCKSAGSYDEVTYCTSCKAELNRVKKTIPMLTTHTPGRAVRENEVAATCKTAGTYDEVTYCTGCKIELSRTEKTIPVLTTHTPGAWQVEKEATETEDGRRCKYCTVCEKLLETEIIPATGDDDDKDEDSEKDNGKFPWWLLLGGSGGKNYDDVTTSDWFYDDVDYVSDHGLMNGTSDDLFSPYENTSRAMIVTILYRMAGEPYVYGGSTFADVADGQWYTNAVIWAAENDIVDGYGNGYFGANDSVTREQLAAILYRYAQFCGKNIATGADLSGYVDCANISSWARTAMEWANAEGLINGRTETTIAPSATANRAELAAILHRFCK